MKVKNIKGSIRSGLLLGLTLIFLNCAPLNTYAENFPDGSPVPQWFSDPAANTPDLLRYSVEDQGAIGDGKTLNTKAIQQTIDFAAEKGGGVIVVPKGKFLTGAIFFKEGTHLLVEKDAVLLGSDDINNFPKIPSRMEGQNLDYYAAVVNAYKCNGFTITGEGTIDGNGLRYWKAFWERRKENPNCTNLEVSRPRLIFVQHSNDVVIRDLVLKNSGFWTTHIYKCNNIKLINLNITSPFEPVKAPSTDAIDVDACKNVLIDGCYLSVNDDAIALKGGKGLDADQDPNNGSNENIIVQNCRFGRSHGCVTCGSEAIHVKNLIFRNTTVDKADRVLWLKNRPDTPQKYEYILIENITGNANRLLFAKPWTQFYNPKEGVKPPVSESSHISFRNINLSCKTMLDVNVTEYDKLTDFSFRNLNIDTDHGELHKEVFNGVVFENVNIIKSKTK